MNKLPTLLTLLALTLPLATLAQPEADRPSDRPDRERPEQRERPDRFSDRHRPGGHDGQFPAKRESIAVDQIQEALDTIRAMHPDADVPWLKRIEAQIEENPEEAARRLSRFPRLHELMDARKNRPDEFELHAKQSQLMRQVFPLVRQLRQAREKEEQALIDELKPKLRAMIEGLFEVRLKLKAIEIERIREHLAKAEQELAEIKADAPELIEQKMNELMTKGDRYQGPREDRDRPDRDR